MIALDVWEVDMEQGSGPDPEDDERYLFVAIGLAVAAALLVVIVTLVVVRGGGDGSVPTIPPATPDAARALSGPSTVRLLPAPMGAEPTRGGPPPGARLAGVGSWSFALGATISGPAADVAPRLRGFDLVVVDGQDASAELVAALRAQGTVVLGYLDVGVIEPNRPWTAGARPYRLDRRQPGDEWYADVAHPGFRTLVTTTMLPPVLARGFDGVFLDHVDMIDSHPAQRDAMVDLVREVSGRVHDRGGVLFAQNGADATIEAVAPFLDGWNRDGVSSTYDAATSAYAAVPVEARQVALATVERLRARNLLVTTIDHLPDPASADAVAARQRACQAGAVPTIGDGGLTLIFPPSRC